MTPIVSILIPTRGRANRLLKTLASLRETASSLDNYEVILRVDEDDEETQFADFNSDEMRHMLIRERVGYGRLGEMYDEMAAMAQAPWIWIMNDDCEVKGRGWDTQIKDYSFERVIFQPEFYQLNQSVYRGGGYTFPVVPNGCWRIAGNLKEPVDAYLDQLLRVDNGWKVKLLEGITVSHVRDNDSTLEEHRKL